MRLFARFLEDVKQAELPPPEPAPAVVTRADVAALPEVVQRYFTAMGVVGTPRVTSLRVKFEGRFRRSADEAWMTATAWQHSQAQPLTRIFTMRVRFAKVVPMLGHDTYIRGSGRMHGKVLGMTVVDGSGAEFDSGELVTYLNDAILLAPSMLLTPAVTWNGLDDRSFGVSLTDSGHTVSATVFLDDRALPVDFSTDDRFMDAPAGPVRRTWRTPITSWDTSRERPFPGPAGATWMTDPPLTYIEGRFIADSLLLNGVAQPG